jgi:acetyltransferase-like isoleucine patch superfamily enzyme
MNEFLKLIYKIYISMTKKYRQKKYTYKVMRVAKEYGSHLKVNGKSRVTCNTVLGENVNFNGMQIVGQGNVEIGNNFHSGTGCQMITQFHNYEGEEIPYDSTYIYRDIKIGDNVWLGNRVIILGGVTIGEGVIIQAGSVVVSDIPDCGIAGGHPAQVFKYRDKAHYYKLKNEGKFH